MYESHWNLERRPFDCGCDAGDYVETASHEAALLKLEYLIESGKGAGVLVGPSGTGKTFLTHVLESRVGDQTGPFARVLYPRMDAAGLVQQIAARLGVSHADFDGASLNVSVELLRRRLAELSRIEQTPVIVIDDGHLVESAEVWHCLRQLMNLRDEEGVAFTLLMAGQPSLLGRLREYPDFYDRASVRVSLPPLSTEQVGAYVAGRLQNAGVDDGVFDVDGLASIAKLSRGLPRSVNQIADLTLLVGYADGLPMIRREQVEAASNELSVASCD